MTIISRYILRISKFTLVVPFLLMDKEQNRVSSAAVSLTLRKQQHHYMGIRVQLALEFPILVFLFRFQVRHLLWAEL